MTALHLPRLRRPVLTVGHVRLMLLAVALGFWWGVISLVRLALP